MNFVENDLKLNEKYLNKKVLLNNVKFYLVSHQIMKEFLDIIHIDFFIQIS
jgi:hypothetical protein